jgi:hypothetical protein
MAPAQGWHAKIENGIELFFMLLRWQGFFHNCFSGDRVSSTIVSSTKVFYRPLLCGFGHRLVFLFVHFLVFEKNQFREPKALFSWWPVTTEIESMSSTSFTSLREVTRFQCLELNTNKRQTNLGNWSKGGERGENINLKWLSLDFICYNNRISTLFGIIDELISSSIYNERRVEGRSNTQNTPPCSIFGTLDNTDLVKVNLSASSRTPKRCSIMETSSKSPDNIFWYKHKYQWPCRQCVHDWYRLNVLSPWGYPRL